MENETPIDDLIAQGCCCGSGCANCPYVPRHTAGGIQLNQQWIDYKHANPDKTYQDWQGTQNSSPANP